MTEHFEKYLTEYSTYHVLDVEAIGTKQILLPDYTWGNITWFNGLEGASSFQIKAEDTRWLYESSAGAYKMYIKVLGPMEEYNNKAVWVEMVRLTELIDVGLSYRENAGVGPVGEAVTISNSLPYYTLIDPSIQWDTASGFVYGAPCIPWNLIEPIQLLTTCLESDVSASSGGLSWTYTTSPTDVGLPVAQGYYNAYNLAFPETTPLVKFQEYVDGSYVDIFNLFIDPDLYVWFYDEDMNQVKSTYPITAYIGPYYTGLFYAGLWQPYGASGPICAQVSLMGHTVSTPPLWAPNPSTAIPYTFDGNVNQPKITFVPFNTAGTHVRLNRMIGALTGMA